MQDKIKYTVVAILPDELQIKIDKLRQRFSFFKPVTKKEPHNLILKDTPHFALKRTFYLNDDYNENKLLRQLDNIRFSPLRLNCKNVGTFANSNYGSLVYLEIEQNKELQQLHLNLKKLVDNFIKTKNPEHEGPGFKPHITFMYDIPNKDIRNVEKTANEEIIPFEFQINCLYLLKDFDTETDEREVMRVNNAIDSK